MKRILLVDDVRSQSAAVAGPLEGAGYSVRAVGPSEVRDEFARATFDLILIGLQTSGPTAVLEMIRAARPQAPVVVITGNGSEDAAEALRRGAVSYLPQRRIDRDLLPVLEQILGFDEHASSGRRTLDCCVEASARFVLGNDVEVIPPQLPLTNGRSFVEREWPSVRRAKR